MKGKKVIITILILALFASCIGGTGIIPQTEKVTMADDEVLVTDTLPTSGTWSEDKWFEESVDYVRYTINVPGDGEIRLKFMAYMYLNFQIYDGEMKEYFRDTTFGIYGDEIMPETKEYSFVFSKGTYYLYLWSYPAGKYKVYYQYTNYHTNDDAAFSYDSPQIVEPGRSVTAALTRTDEEDWFKFTVPKNGYYTFSFISYIEVFDLYWHVYNWDLTEDIAYDSVYNASSTSPYKESWDIYLKKGTYYLRTYSAGEGKYYFSWKALSQPSCSHDYNGTQVSSTYFSKGYTRFKCSKCGKTYKGSYTAKKKLGKGYISGGTIGKKKVKISFYSISGVSGYQIRYSTNKKMKKSKIVKVSKKKNSKTIKGLKSKKMYYFQLRGYVKSGKKIAYGAWSSKAYGKIK